MMTVRTLTDGGQQPLEIAQLVGDFLAAAQRSLDIAIYDLKLEGETERIVIGAIEAAAARGVAVRIAYNSDFRAPIPVPPPPESAPEDIEGLKVPTKPIAGIPDLMHHKYVVRDGASVWTGSANWTDDSWSREENVIVVADSPELAHAFTLDFDQLWASGNVENTGQVEPRPVRVDGIEVRPWFCPGFGDALSHRIAKHLGRAKRRIRVCSPVITAAVTRGVNVRLLYNVDEPRPAASAGVPPPKTSPAEIEAMPFPTSGSRAGRISCTTSTSSATARRCGRARRTGPTTRGRARRM
jgi:hypothetical protein